MDIFASLAQTPGYPLLFVLSFFAATVLPLGSEWLVVVMVLQGFSVQDIVITATSGNYLGACTTFILGVWGANFLIHSLLRIDEHQLEKAQRLYEKYGSWSLLLSWLPVVGDPLCLVAGAFRVSFLRFSLLVFAGKFTRYACLAILTRQGMQITGGS